MLVAGGLVDVEVLGSLGATVEVMGLTLLLLLCKRECELD